MSHEVIQSLETIRGRVNDQLLNVKAYRALLAVDTAIMEISEVDTIVEPLKGVRNQVLDCLGEVPEYRALQAVHKSIAYISEVLGLLEGSALKKVDPSEAPGPTSQAEDLSTTLAETETAESNVATPAIAAADQSNTPEMIVSEVLATESPFAGSSNIERNTPEPAMEVAVAQSPSAGTSFIESQSEAPEQPEVHPALRAIGPAGSEWATSVVIADEPTVPEIPTESIPSAAASPEPVSRTTDETLSDDAETEEDIKTAKVA